MTLYLGLPADSPPVFYEQPLHISGIGMRLLCHSADVWQLHLLFFLGDPQKASLWYYARNHLLSGDETCEGHRLLYCPLLRSLL